MGIMEDAKAEKSRARKQRKGSHNSYSTFFTFHPTNEQKHALRHWDVELQEVLEGLASKIEGGFKLSIGQKPESGTFFAIMRQNGDDWKNTPACSYWNLDMTKTLVGLYYYLTSVNPSWPEGRSSVVEEETDW